MTTSQEMTSGTTAGSHSFSMISSRMAPGHCVSVLFIQPMMILAW